MMGFDEFVDSAKRSVASIAQSFTNYDDEWESVILFDGPEVNGVAPIGHFLEDPETRKQLSEDLIPKVIVDTKSLQICFVLASWVLEGSSMSIEEALASGSIENHPDRREVMRIIGMRPGRIEMWSAAVGRDPLNIDPPTLGPFELIFAKDVMDSLAGAVIDVDQNSLYSMAYLALEFNNTYDRRSGIMTVLSADPEGRTLIDDAFASLGTTIEEVRTLLHSDDQEESMRAVELIDSASEIFTNDPRALEMVDRAKVVSEAIHTRTMPENPSLN